MFVKNQIWIKGSSYLSRRYGDKPQHLCGLCIYRMRSHSMTILVFYLKIVFGITTYFCFIFKGKNKIRKKNPKCDFFKGKTSLSKTESGPEIRLSIGKVR